MAGIIKIRKLRNIESLDFEIPNPGVWLLTAGNGAGKTSLLACLRRIKNPIAFPAHFPSSLESDRLDNHSNGTVTYILGDKSVEYAYRGERWTPRPRRNSSLFDDFPYPSVIYIGATADRITPRPEDFDTRNIRSANRDLKDGANFILETEKFNNLRTINLTRGGGNSAFVMDLGGDPKKYHSEKHFSLGELCVLKLIKSLNDSPVNSMVLIDELEMALHPRAQVNLLKHLQDMAKKKNLTIIFSTHSVTLLKSIDRKNIILMERGSDGNISIVRGCFPTYAIGGIASDEEALPDILIYVEDNYAKVMVLAFYNKYIAEKINNPALKPTLKVVPIGGFSSVIGFVDRQVGILPDHVSQMAILDADVKEETLKNWKNNDKHERLAQMQKVEKFVNYLPFTPEVGLAQHILDGVDDFTGALRGEVDDNQIQVKDVIKDYDKHLVGGDLRRSAKVSIDQLVSRISQRCGYDRERSIRVICGIFAEQTWQQYRPHFMKLFGGLL